MASSEAIETKLQLLQLLREEAEAGLQRNKRRELIRHSRELEKHLDDIYEKKTVIREEKLQNGEAVADVKAWSADLEEKLLVYEDLVEDIANGVDALKIAKEIEERSEVSESKPAVVTREFKMKLPALQITKFKGTYVDWPRFWNIFEAEIDKSSAPVVTKFNYLKELCETKVRALIDGLPYSSEGYERAKNILSTSFGKTSEIVNAHITNVMDLPRIAGASPKRILDFYETLIMNIQPLETMGKLKEINGYVRMTLDKLPGIRSDIVRMDDDWQDWDFPRLAEALRKWTDRNPLPNLDERETSRPSPAPIKRDKTYATNGKQIPCVYCEKSDHKSFQCTEVSNISERKGILSAKRLCFNCTNSDHRASDCQGGNCHFCKRRHHSSICDQKAQGGGSGGQNNPRQTQPLMCSNENNVIYPILVVEVNGFMCRALLDTGAGSCYVSASLVRLLKLVPCRTENREIEMLLATTTKEFEKFQINLGSVKSNFCLKNVEVSKVEKDVLLSVQNPHYPKLLRTYEHLRGIVIEDSDEKDELPIHMVIGLSEFTKVKTSTPARVGKIGEPVAERTELGWCLMSPGTEVQSRMYLAQTTPSDYDRLCSLDVLGLEDSSTTGETVYSDFKDQLVRRDGYYETGLIRKVGHPPLLSNEKGSRARTSNLLRRLKSQPETLREYHEVIQAQKREGIVEVVEPSDDEKQNICYIPHRPVIKRSAESTQLRIVYDGSASEKESPSLNEVLETGPPLQNLLWDIVVSIRFAPVILAGDLKKAFLQVRIRPEDRDLLRFHWVKDLETFEIEVLRFCRALFGLVQSPFLLGAVLEVHFDWVKQKYPELSEIVDVIRRALYVDDLIVGATCIEFLKTMKEKSVFIFKEASFDLHKWHSNVRELEDDGGSDDRKTKLLGLPWDKDRDLLSITFPDKPTSQTKRKILSFLAAIYDLLGMVSPVTLKGKLIYRDVCDAKFPWDEPITGVLVKRWLKFMERLPTEAVSFPRSIVTIPGKIDYVEFHVFSDASVMGVAAMLYAIVYQHSRVTQGLVASKSRLAKKASTIPRLELIACHMGVNLVENVKKAVDPIPVKSVTAWSDSTVALHWIKGGGNYKQFVKKRVDAINSKSSAEWRHVPGELNPSDIASRGCFVEELTEIWWHGPNWLPVKSSWPEDIKTEPSPESEAERKAIKEIFAVALPADYPFRTILEKFKVWKATRIMGWASRFLLNSKASKKERTTGPLNTEEIASEMRSWVKRDQAHHFATEEFETDRQRLNLQLDDDGIFRCRGRIQGDYPIYLPGSSILSVKLVERFHAKTLHGGVSMTMTAVREEYWIPRLRRLTKKVIFSCFLCVRFRAVHFPAPAPGLLPRDRTDGVRPFQVLGLDFAGPIAYRKKKWKGKCYIFLYTCSLTRAVYLELLPDQTLEEVQKSLKRLIARRGRPEKIYSDNFASFKAAAKWLKSEKLHNFLASEKIRWQFNLSRAPWWGGQFERIVGLVKRALYKVVGSSLLNWSELEEVLLDVETALNNRPLSYVEEDEQLPVLTPNVMLFGIPNCIPEPDRDEEPVDLRKRAKHLAKCKEKLWVRWSTEYIKSLRERHNMKSNSREASLKAGDVVMIRGDVPNRGTWRVGVVDSLIVGKDGVTRGAGVRTGKSTLLQRAVQQLYPLELSCDTEFKKKKVVQPYNVEAREFVPKRGAAVAASKSIKEQMDYEHDLG